MPDYVPTPGPLPGRQWIPSNGSEGASFLESFCSCCARDAAMREGKELEECDDNEVCPIIAASFRDEAVEWRQDDDGAVYCLAYVRVGTPIPAPRCPNTGDMFEEPPHG